MFVCVATAVYIKKVKAELELLLPLVCPDAEKDLFVAFFELMYHRLSYMRCRSGERDRYGRLRQYRRSMSRDRGRRRRRSRDEDKFKGSLSEGMKVDQESSGEEL